MFEKKVKYKCTARGGFPAFKNFGLVENMANEVDRPKFNSNFRILGFRMDFQTPAADVFITKLRKKLQGDPQKSKLLNIRGFGIQNWLLNN